MAANSSFLPKRGWQLRPRRQTKIVELRLGSDMAVFSGCSGADEEEGSAEIQEEEEMRQRRPPPPAPDAWRDEPSKGDLEACDSRQALGELQPLSLGASEKVGMIGGARGYETDGRIWYQCKVHVPGLKEC